ncbi:TRAP transporter large permease [Mycetocola zhadangensis]|uniref:TRAP transporter large permease n=1 Tax=Mycetocola zhadangensis TaxID=1164595 RepID=UPI003A4E19ED
MSLNNKVLIVEDESPAAVVTDTTRRPGDPKMKTKGTDSRRITWAFYLLLALAAVSVAAIFLAPTRQLVGASAVVLMLVLMFMKLPIAFSLIIPGVVGLFSLSGFRAMENIMTGTPFSATASWSLSVLPMFILMGMLLASSGITTRVYEAARLWTGWLPGGLAIGTNIAGAGLAAVSGSTIGNAYALGRVGVPEMLRAGYDRRLAVGSVTAAGLPGQVIPPSTFLIIVAGITGVSVGPQLIAGIVPGVAMVVLFCLTILLLAIMWPSMIGRGKKASTKSAAAAASSQVTATWGERIRSLGGVWPILVLFVGIFGLMFGGVLTATEAGASGAFIAVLLTWFFRRKEKPFKFILKGAVETVSSVGGIFFVLIGAHVLTQLIAVTRIGTAFSDWIVSLGLERVGFLLVVMGVYLVLGMFMDPLAILLLTIPILQPTLVSLDINLLWFGVFAVLMGELAIITPPVGVLTFIMHGLVQDPAVNLGHKITLKDVFQSVGLFMPAILVLVTLMIFFPETVTWLPSLMVD